MRETELRQSLNNALSVGGGGDQKAPFSGRCRAVCMGACWMDMVRSRACVCARVCVSVGAGVGPV